MNVLVLDRYLARTIASTIVLVTFALLGIITLFSIIAEIENIERGYRLSNALLFVVYTTPRRFYEMIPYCALIGCLLGLGGLSSSSELTAMRAAGVSRLRIAVSALLPVMALVLFGMSVGEWVAPASERAAQVDRERARSDSISSDFGFWYREGNTYMHFLRVETDGSLTGITHYETDDFGRIRQSLYAESADFHTQGGESWWMLHGVSISRIDEPGVQITFEESRKWVSAVDPDVLRSEILVEPDELSIAELNTRIHYLDRQNLDSRSFRLALWSKLLQPLATLALVFVAITFIFGPLREVPMGVRVVAGLVVGILFKFLQDLLTPASMVYGFAPVLAALVPIIGCFAFGSWLLARGR